MRAIEVLSEEHRVLLDALCRLDRLLLEAARDDDLDTQTAQQVLAFLERFADGSHREKEELALFPILAARAAGSARLLVGRLLEAHADEHELLEELRSKLEGAAYGDAVSRDTFVLQGRKYSELQHRHARTEEQVLFPLAERSLCAEDDRAILAAFDRIEARSAHSPLELEASLAGVKAARTRSSLVGR